MRKLFLNAVAALDGLLRDDRHIAGGGLDLCGIPERLLETACDDEITGLTGRKVVDNVITDRAMFQRPDNYSPFRFIEPASGVSNENVFAKMAACFTV